MSIKAVIVMDPTLRAGGTVEDESIPHVSKEDADADAKLLFYHDAEESVPVEERRSQSNLIQGVMAFGKFCALSTTPAEPLQIETEQLLILAVPVETDIVVAIVFSSSTSLSVGSALVDRFYSYYKLLHGTIRGQLVAGYALQDTMSDYVSSFIASESGSGSIPAGIRYAPVERHCLVAAHAFGLELMSEFPDLITDFSLTYRGFLVSSSIDPELLLPLYTYMCLDPRTGSCSNSKLLSPPYSRIGTPAILPGGGSSAFGRCNFFDLDNDSEGFLFGPTGVGEAVFSPVVYLGDGTPRYLVTYLINGLMLTLLVTTVDEFQILVRLEKYIKESHELNDEIMSLLRGDFAKASRNSGKEPFEYVSRNIVNKSLIVHEAAGRSQRSVGGLFAGSRLLNPFGGGTRTHTTDPTTSRRHDSLSDRLDALVTRDPTIASVAVKASSNEGWRVYSRRDRNRSIQFEFKDPKIPLWRINEDIENFIKVKFDSIYV